MPQTLITTDTPARPRARVRLVPLVVVAFVAFAAIACQAGLPWVPGIVRLVVAPTDATLDGLNIHTQPDFDGRLVVRYDWAGTASFRVSLPADSDNVVLVMRGDQCDGAPSYNVSVDGLQIATDTAATATWSVHSYKRRLLAGTHVVSVEYTNDQATIGSCDRNLFLESLQFTSDVVSPVITSNAPAAGTYVHQSGTQLLDGAGRPLKLRGVNVGGWLYWEGWMWGQAFDYVGQRTMEANLDALVGPASTDQFTQAVADSYVTGDDFNAIEHYGMNVARIPFNYRLLEDDTAPYVYKASGWAALDKAVAAAKAHGVYLVLDLHAAQCGQTLSFTSDWDGSSYLWLSQPCQDRSIAMWKAIAARYATEPIIAGYDLLNETVAGNGALLDWYKRATAAIRSVDPNHLLIYQGNNLAQDFWFTSTPIDSNMMLSVHDYPWLHLGQDISTRVAGYRAAAVRLNAPVWVGEFGQSSYDDIARYVDLFDQDPTFAGWAQWMWKQVPGAPTMQTIEHTPASKKVIEWAINPSRPKPTPAEAQQGITDFVDATKFADTLPDAKLQDELMN